MFKRVLRINGFFQTIITTRKQPYQLYLESNYNLQVRNQAMLKKWRAYYNDAVVSDLVYVRVSGKWN